MERKGDVWFRIHLLNKKKIKKGGGLQGGGESFSFLFILYAAAAIYLHGEVMLDIYYNDLYKEIYSNCFTVLF